MGSTGISYDCSTYRPPAVFFVPASPLAEVLPNDPPHSLSSSAPMEEATPNVKTTGRFRDLKNSMAQHGTTIYDNNSKKQKS